MRRLGVVVAVVLVVLVGPAAPPAGPAAPPDDHPSAAQAAGTVAVRPVPGAVVRPFDPPDHPWGPGHRGVDLAAGPGQPVRAALPGRVTFAGQVAGDRWVTVRHGPRLDTTYGVFGDLAVHAGQPVRAGDVLGVLAADATHLDWGARSGGVYLDPLTLLVRWRLALVPTRG